MDNYFLEMIRTLRKQEEVILYGNILHVNEKSTESVVDFLYNEYQKELLEYPDHQAPEFDPVAALWAAKTIYIAAQLLLYRENKETDLDALLPDYTVPRTASSVLSADLCLRFLPDILVKLKMIDSEDALIEILERKIVYWHYSGINYDLPIEELDFDSMFAETGLKGLYINRIITYKKMNLANHTTCKEQIAGYLGMYADQFWKEFNREKLSDGKY
jgi:hypothetical protein